MQMNGGEAAQVERKMGAVQKSVTCFCCKRLCISFNYNLAREVMLMIIKKMLC